MDEIIKSGTDGNRDDRKPRKIWHRIIKWILATICLIAAVLTIAITAVVLILTPERLTPLVEKYGSEYLLADIGASRVELTFWSTFPELTLEVDSLSVKTRGVPEEYSRLLEVDHLHGTVNLPALLKYSVELKDLYIRHPQAMLVTMRDGKSNFDIVPSSGTDSVEDDKSQLPPPSISFNRFLIEQAGPIRVISLKDTSEIRLDIHTLDLGGKNSPAYLLKIAGNGSMAAPVMKFNNIALGLDGKIVFDIRHPERLCLENMSVGIDSLNANFDTSLLFGDTLTVETLKFNLPEWSVSRIIGLTPENMAAQLKDIRTDMRLNLRGELLKPYKIAMAQDSAGTVPVPEMDVSISIPQCSASYRRLKLTRLELDADIRTSSKGPDATRIGVNRLIVSARNLGFGIKGNITTPISNPRFNGTVKGGVNLYNLPREIYSKFASELSGKVTTDIKLRASAADFSPKGFHRLFIEGNVDLENLRFISPDSMTELFTRESNLHFGSNLKFTNKKSQVVDSLLSVSIKGDTVLLRSDRNTISLSQYRAGAGTRIMHNRADSTIVPIGAHIEFSRLRANDVTDSLIFAMRDSKCTALITQYANDNRKPLIRLMFDNRFTFGGTPDGRVGLAGAHIDLTAHFRERHVANDSLRMARRAGRAARDLHIRRNDASREQLDLEVDSGIKALLNKWNISGHIRAKGGRGFFKAFPAQNIIRNVDLTFNTDSVSLRNFSYSIGNSDFLVNGLISNIRRALTRKRNNTISIDVDIKSDTIDVNFLSALAMQSAGSIDIPENEDEAEKMTDRKYTVAATDTTPMKPITIPANIDGRFKLRSANLIYTDFIFTNFTGDVRIKDSAAQLRNLAATSSIGHIDLTALYSAPNAKDIEFGMGMNVNNFHIERMIKLIPAIDSLMPMIKDFSGIINADLAATAKIDSMMNVDIPSLQAALKLSGDSLVLLDADTFKSLSKWLFFKNKKRNMIDKMEVEMVIDNSTIEVFPFIFDIDRYRLGVMGSNDMNMNLNYHISVLKSPMPFKFGINIKGNIDNMKIRLGGAKFKNNTVIERVSIADTTRLNLVNQIENIFRRSARTGLRMQKPKTRVNITDEPADTLNAAERSILEGQ